MNHPAAVSEVLARARLTHSRAAASAQTLINSRTLGEKLTALQMVIIFGVSMTHVLQNLRSVVDEFDPWWATWRHQLENDPLLRYLYKLRSSILKEGRDQVTSVTSVGDLTLPDDLGEPPVGAIGTYVGADGAGWEVRLEDGTIEQVPVVMPEAKISYWLGFADCPHEHLGRHLIDLSAQGVCRLYVDFLGKILEAARIIHGSSRKGGSDQWPDVGTASTSAVRRDGSDDRRHPRAPRHEQAARGRRRGGRMMDERAEEAITNNFSRRSAHCTGSSKPSLSPIARGPSN